MTSRPTKRGAKFARVKKEGHQRSERKAENIDFRFQAYIDFHGYHGSARGWFVGGWIAYPWPAGYRPENLAAVFDDGSMIPCAQVGFYDRDDDFSGRGIGFICFFPTGGLPAATLLAVMIEFGGIPHTISLRPGAQPGASPELTKILENLLLNGETDSQHQGMLSLLAVNPALELVEGFIDFYGHCSAAGGWFCCGWVNQEWLEEQPPEWIVVSASEGVVAGEGFAVVYPRSDDLPDGAAGVVLFVRDDLRPVGKFLAASFTAGGIKATLTVTSLTARLREAELVSRLRPLIRHAAQCLHRDILWSLLSRQGYRGEDTLKDLTTPVFFEIDEAIVVGTDSLVLIGWQLFEPSDVRAIRLRCGSLSTLVDLQRSCLRVERPDIAKSFAQNGFSDSRCGFVVYLAHSIAAGQRLYLEIETVKLEVGYRAVPPPKLVGLAAIKRLLSIIDPRFDEVPQVFDHVLGPAIEGVNKARLAKRPDMNVLEYGQTPANPSYSVVVPLYGRLDFVEYQLALFSEHPHCDTEFIYVLDDPPKRREAQFLFASVFERYQIPFKAILLKDNVGFAPANNIGLNHARGEFISFLNSDVFPGTLDWLERLAGRLRADQSIGVIGPVLEFEDGSVQHRGMCFTRLPEFGNWFFPKHYDKGLKHLGGRGPEQQIAITGACMLMARQLALDVGGMDETYIIGDFEDSDLCLNLQARGYRCVIDPQVRLYHLERKSQASSSLGWRMNLTLYNAWQHERRWSNIIEAQQNI